MHWWPLRIYSAIIVLHFCSIIYVTTNVSLNEMQPFIQHQSSCNKSTKRCVQAVKLNSLKEKCFYFIFERRCADSFPVLILFWLCTFIASPTAVTTASRLVLHPCNTTFVIKTIFRSFESLIQILAYFSFFHSPSLSLSLSLSLSSLLSLVKHQMLKF